MQCFNTRVYTHYFRWVEEVPLRHTHFAQYLRSNSPFLQEFLSSSSNSEDMTLCEDSDVLSGLPDSRLLPGMRGHRLDLLEGAAHSGDMHPTDTNTTSTESSDLQNPSLTQFSLDEDGRILPYVNFDLYYQAVEDAREAGLISDSQIHLYK